MGEMQVGGTTGGVMGMISAVHVMLAEWVGEMQVGGRTGGVMGKNSVVLEGVSEMGG